MINTVNRNGSVLIRVADNGIGINSSDQKRVFEKLYRVPTGNLHNFKGFGLGLSYVKAIVEMHEGIVSVESEPGKGTTFIICLPIKMDLENVGRKYLDGRMMISKNPPYSICGTSGRKATLYLKGR